MKNKKCLLFIIILTFVLCFAGDCFATVGKIKTAGNAILSALLWFGYAIALGMVIFIGIKYILGSADAKANMKSAIVNWLIGAFVVFMCTTIVGWVTGVIGADTNLSNAANGIVHAPEDVGD